MASAAPAVPHFNHRLHFGEHHLPIDTAKSMWILPRTVYPWGKDLSKQAYQLTIRFSTLKEGKPFGWGDYILDIDEGEKLNRIVGELRRLNVQWNMWVDKVVPSLRHRRIDLFFDNRKLAGNIAEAAGGTGALHWGNIYLWFQRALGIQSDDRPTQIVEFEGGKNAVRISFPEGPRLKERMEAALRRLDDLSVNHQIARCLDANAQFNLEIPEVPPHEPPPIDPSAAESSGDENSPCFTLTETTIEPTPPWRAEDLPWLIATSRPAPAEAGAGF